MPTVTIGENTADDHAGCEENHIQLFSPTVNNGAATVAEITKYGSGDWTHLLMKFTGLDSITGTVTVSSATLNIQQDEDAASSGHDDTITVRECYRAWSELQSTWNIFSTSNNWQTAGGIGAADRNNTTALGTFTTSTASTGTSGVYRSFTSAALAQWAEDVINGSISSANGLHFERTTVPMIPTTGVFRLVITLIQVNVPI